MSEGVWLDPDAARELAGECRTAAGEVESARSDAVAGMALSELSDVGADVLAELADELTVIADLVEIRADLMTYADLPMQGWLAWMYGEAAELEVALAASLDDEDGANRADAAPFTLAGSLTFGFDTTELMQANWDRDVYGDYGWGDDRGYWGGGYIVGPDGRRYPIVIPWMEIDGEVYTADSGPGVEVATLGGADDGWSIVTVRSGVERFQGEPNLGERLLAGVGGSTGLITPLPGNDQLPGIVMSPDHPPYFTSDIPLDTAVTAPEYAALPMVPVTMLVGGVMRQVHPDNVAFASREVRRAALRYGITPPDAAGTVVGGALDLAVPVGQGVDVALSFDNQNERAYQVIFEENEDGRVRARVESFWLTSDGETVGIQPRHIFFDEDGEVAEQPIEYAPYTAAVVTAAGGDYVIAQGVDLPHDWEIHDDVFPE